MDKKEFINHIKKFLPSNCTINIKSYNKDLIKIKKKLFLTEINIHSTFLKADKNIIQDILIFINQDKNKNLKEVKYRLSKFFEENYVPKKFKINNKFKYKNIEKLFQNIITRLNDLYNNINFFELKITWGKNYKYRRRSIRFGSFDKKHNLIRIHPALDNSYVPDFFINSIIYHEVAHFIIHKTNKKSLPHSKVFYNLLKMIDPDYNNSRIWEKNNKMIFFN